MLTYMVAIHQIKFFFNIYYTIDGAKISSYILPHLLMSLIKFWIK